MTTATSVAAIAATLVEVVLDSPISRGEETISIIRLRKPGSGELRGLSLVSLGQMAVDELIKLLPRITTPTLLPHEINQLDPADLVEIANRVTDFLLPRRIRDSLPTT